ncbi:RsmB/NOP family class I SAM-dependent RNA methyltransferase [Candidatus Bathyarchaeota archaeon]|nr:MAG: RsmB/NOP family class I SAM-dependent RNA methyltransferase [Candidatus Bathyarchaeota archaeon]
MVAKGASERSAIQQLATSDPNLANVKHESLDLVLTTLRNQDVLDRIVQDALPNEILAAKTLPLFRLATQLLMKAHGKDDVRRKERGLRNVTPVEYLPRLEILLGSVLGHDPYRIPSTATDAVGRSEAIKLLSTDSRPRYIRVNPLMNRGRTTLPAQAKRLAGKLTKVPSDPGVYLLNGSPSEFSAFFSQGLFQMQDFASYLAVKAGGPEPGETVLDLCAAPGAKTATLAQFMKNRGKIVSVDYSQSRMEAWKRETSRLGVKIAEPVISDAARLAVHGAFDLIIIDPPCTGTGVFDRNPRMKWHLSPKSLERYATLQQQFMDSATPLVAEEGRILYCTCSIAVEENEQVVSTFLKSHPEFETRPILEEYGSPGLKGLTDCRRLFPHRDRTAGYFISLMQRTN